MKKNKKKQNKCLKSVKPKKQLCEIGEKIKHYFKSVNKTKQLFKFNENNNWLKSVKQKQDVQCMHVHR